MRMLESDHQAGFEMKIAKGEIGNGFALRI
jgi:hypothetical protein